MVFDMVWRLARIRLTVGYAVTLLTVATTLLVLGPQAREQVVANASTNLHNLSHGHLATLVGSAFVPDDAAPVYLWLPGLVCLLALAELFWRSLRVAAVLVVGHIGATLVVATGLGAALKLGWLPASVGLARDVGMSYGAAAVVGALTAAIPARWRPAWIGWWVAVALGTAALSAEFTEAGHAVAVLLGMVVAHRLGRPGRWTRMRVVLLAVSVVFGFVTLAHTGVSVLAGVALGALGAVLADRIARQRLLGRSLTVLLGSAQPVQSI
jgi:hypothetical protein